MVSETRDIQFPNGVILRGIPADATDEQILAKLKSKDFETYKVALHQMIERGPQGDPSVGPGSLGFAGMDTGIEVPQGVNRFLAGAGKSMVDLARGTEQIARQVVPGVSPEEAALQAEIDTSRKLDAPLSDTGAGLAGNVTGAIATGLPTMLIPGVNTYRGAALVGGLMGAAQPVAEGESREANIAMGAGGGLLGRAGAGVASRVLAPKTSEGVKSLLKEGIDLTPGQVAGGAAQRTEDALTAVPFMGDAMLEAKRRGVASFNKAALKRVLAPIGGKAEQIGREGIEAAHAQITSAYDDVLKGANTKIDPKFIDDIRGLGKLAKKLKPDQQRQFAQIVQADIADRMGAGNISGETFKIIDSELGRQARGLAKSTAYDDQQLSKAIASAQKSLRNMLARQNPTRRERLRAVDRAYSRLLKVENAAGRAGAQDGVFTPAQLKAATRAMDSSLRKRAFSQGRVDMQDLAENAAGVLPSKVPDSGTPTRAITSALAGGGLMYLDPALLGGALGAAGLYTRPALKAAQAAMTARPAAARAVGGLLEAGKPLAGIAGSSLLTR